ncbi:hypothetical protein ACFLQJ_02145, partial [Calditrichota bacterium]
NVNNRDDYKSRQDHRHKLHYIGLVIFLTLIIFMAYANFNSMNTNYLYIKENDFVIIKNGNNYVMCAKYEHCTGTLLPQYRVYKQGDLEEYTIVEKDLGRLRAYKPPKPGDENFIGPIL